MWYAAFIWIVVACLTQPTVGEDVIDNNINFFNISQPKSYGGIIIGDLKRFYQSLCNQTFKAYKNVKKSDNKIRTEYVYFSKYYNPDDYLKSFQCKKNETYIFICQRMLKTYRPLRGQTWYNFSLQNTSCNLDGIRILSSVNQVLANKHFIDINAESVLLFERRAAEVYGKKEICSCRDQTPEPLPSSSSSSSTAMSTKASSLITQLPPSKSTSKPTEMNPLKTMKTSFTSSLVKLQIHSSYHTQPMTYVTTFTTENTQSRSSALSTDTKSSQSSRIEEKTMEYQNGHAHIPIYVHILIGTLSFTTVALLVLTVYLCLQQRKNNQSGKVRFKEEHDKVFEEAALNEYTNIPESSDK